MRMDENKMTQTGERLLTVDNLKTTFMIHKTKVEAVRGASIHVDDGDILAVVGESGSGKSVLMKSIMGLLPENAQTTADSLVYMGRNLLEFSADERRKMRGKEFAMIFQDPMTALNPLKKIGAHLTEVLMRYRKLNKKQAREEAIEALRKVGIPSPEKRLDQYPHEFSGGMRQRVLIAMALCCKPKLLIADEPTTGVKERLEAIPGMAPSLTNPPAGCPFAERCKYACEKCESEIPAYRQYTRTQRAMCVFTEEELNAMDKEGKADGRTE